MPRECGTVFIAMTRPSARSRAGRKTRGSQPHGKDPLARLRAICLALPEANEKLSHGEPTWFAGKGKVFAMLDNHHHGAPTSRSGCPRASVLRSR